MKRPGNHPNIQEYPDLQEILFSKEDIQKRIRTLAKKIAAHYKPLLNKTNEDGTSQEPAHLHVIGVLVGAFIFVTDIVRYLEEEGVSVRLDFVSVSSYGSGTTGAEVRFLLDTKYPVTDSHVLIVEDIIDSGKSLEFLKMIFECRKPKSLQLACFLVAEESRRKVDINIDWVGFALKEPKFVVGYGLDVAGYYRALPFVAVLTDEAIEKFSKNNK